MIVICLLSGHQCVHSRELSRVLQPQSFLHHSLLLWTTSSMQVSIRTLNTPLLDAGDISLVHMLCCCLLLIHFHSLPTREPGVWALERAKQNVLENYLLVGILEELEDVLLLLERLLPHYFTGVLNIYKSPGRYHILRVLLSDSLIGFLSS